MHKEEVLARMSQDLTEFESLHQGDFAVTNLISTMREHLAELKKAPYVHSTREYVPVLTGEEVYEHIQQVETDNTYRESLERGIKTCEELVKRATPSIAAELASYGVVAMVISNDKDRGEIIDFVNTQALYTIKPK